MAKKSRFLHTPVEPFAVESGLTADQILARMEQSSAQSAAIFSSSWSSNDVPRLGSGVAWMEPDFAASGWPSANLPAGYGFGGLATDLSFAMKISAAPLKVA